MKNVSTTVKKPLDLCDSLYDLRKAKGALSALCDELDEFGISVCHFDDDYSQENAMRVACDASRDFDTWKLLIFSARDIIADQIAALDPPEDDGEEK
ncbi:hypothetical protein U9I39_13990 [Lacticaseibacillus rhamnosus]|uniref:Phage protein n=1 Tax=Lacticaseibacillus zeae subsp. silagei TaxID=3068307 RepID=A0ABD7Z9H4_LACZE|nr:MULTISPECIES: hypothetical protein [Lacticaseibacillus]MDE3316793.1 hypothetical protein [Lacticaseibacillus zeae]WLV83585.1 hypothetical protein LACZS2_002832 [Lacticaseibacillus sp. NCIMB 15475]